MLQGDLKLEVNLGAVTLCCVVAFINMQNAMNCVSLEWGNNCGSPLEGQKKGFAFKKRYVLAERCNHIPNSVTEISAKK